MGLSSSERKIWWQGRLTGIISYQQMSCCKPTLASRDVLGKFQSLSLGMESVYARAIVSNLKPPPIRCVLAMFRAERKSISCWRSFPSFCERIWVNDSESELMVGIVLHQHDWMDQKVWWVQPTVSFDMCISRATGHGGYAWKKNKTPERFKQILKVQEISNRTHWTAEYLIARSCSIVTYLGS